jgi:hypothetical protein
MLARRACQYRDKETRLPIGLPAAITSDIGWRLETFWTRVVRASGGATRSRDDGR